MISDQGTGSENEPAKTLRLHGEPYVAEEQEGEPWRPKAGDLYLSSYYYESEDGRTEATEAEGDANFATNIEMMDDLVRYLDRTVAVRTDAPDGIASPAVLDAIFDYISNHQASESTPW